MPTNEELAAKFRAESRTGDGRPEGTRQELERCARMLDNYAPDLYPANEQGQIDFARALMETTADQIRAFLARPRPTVTSSEWPSTCANCGCGVENDAQAFIHACLHSGDTKWSEFGNAAKLNKLPYILFRIVAELMMAYKEHV